MSGFTDLRLNHSAGRTDESFWPSFTDIMAVVTMIFLITTSVLILRNFELLRQITATAEAERQAAEIARSASAENATLEEQLANAEYTVSMLRLDLLKSAEDTVRLQRDLADAQQTLSITRSRIVELSAQLNASQAGSASLETENATLRAQIGHLQNELASLQQTLQSDATERTALQQAVAAGRSESQQLQRQLEVLQADRDRVQARARSAGEEAGELRESKRELELELALMRQRSQQAEQRFGSLRGDFDDLQLKYDRLIRPARTAAGKYVVEVRYRRLDSDRHEIRFRIPESGEFRLLDQAALERELSELKQRYPQQLYIKIIFPEDSGLTYDDAWSFTTDLLRRYDYYYQDAANSSP